MLAPNRKTNETTCNGGQFIWIFGLWKRLRNCGSSEAQQSWTVCIANTGIKHPLLEKISCIEGEVMVKVVHFLYCSPRLFTYNKASMFKCWKTREEKTDQEAKDVGVLLYRLAGGLSSSMARLCVHPHHQGLGLTLMRVKFSLFPNSTSWKQSDGR